jgi:hypothetical protein
MYNHESTLQLDDPDPLDREVSINPDDERPSAFLDDNLINELAAAAASHSGATPTPQLAKLFVQASVRIYERFRRYDGIPASVKDADAEVVRCFCWIAITRDAKTEPNEPKWFKACSHLSIRVGLGKQVGCYHVGRLARSFRLSLYESTEFAIYRGVRQGAARRVPLMRGPYMPFDAVLSQIKWGISSAIETSGRVGRRSAPRPPSAATLPQPVAEEKNLERGLSGKTSRKVKPRKKQASVIISLTCLKCELHTLNAKRKAKGWDELRLTPTSLASISPPGCPHAATWRKLFNEEPLRRDVRDHLTRFFEHFGHQLKKTDIRLKWKSE